MIDDDALGELRSAMLDYIDQHGLPSDPEALAWFIDVAREGTTPEQAFAPMYDGYFTGSGGMFTTANWMEWTTNIENILLRPDRGGGVYFNFDFDFDSDSGDDSPGSGSRGGYGRI